MLGVLHDLEKDRKNKSNEFVGLPPNPPKPNMILSCLKRPLTPRLLSKVIPGKKSIKFTKFDGMEDPKMHVHRFQEEDITYMHDKDLLSKLVSHSLRDQALN